MDWTTPRGVQLAMHGAYVSEPAPHDCVTCERAAALAAEAYQAGQKDADEIRFGIAYDQGRAAGVAEAQADIDQQREYVMLWRAKAQDLEAALRAGRGE